MAILDQQTQDYCAKIRLSTKTIALFERYLTLLCAANENCNLVGRQQDNHRICHYHVIDCLLPLPFLPRELKSVYDIGTGAGLPGLLWAMARPDLQFYLVEKSPKKCQFLTETISALQLKNTQVLNKRSDAVSGVASLIVSRAMASTADLLVQTEQLADKTTQWCLMKALRSSIDQELNSVNTSLWRVSVQPLVHPTQDVSRHLVWVTQN
jgi:16S rRNA (guanine527-N7)-methyltransferase